MALSTPAFAASPSQTIYLDCVAHPGDANEVSLTRASYVSFVTIAGTTDDAHKYKVIVETDKPIVVSKDGSVIATVNSGTQTLTDLTGHVKFARQNWGTTTIRAFCATETAETISQLQSVSPLMQTNMASAGAAFQSLMDFDILAETSGSVEPTAFWPDQARAQDALKAIDGTFSFLGYGPDATLNGDRILAIGDDWFIKGLVKANYAESDVTGGKFTQTNGQASVLMQKRFDNGQRLAVALTGGLGHASIPDQSDDSQSLIVDLAYAMPLTSTLSLITGANWGMANHDVEIKKETGSYVEQMVSGSVTLRGEQSYGAVTLVPTLTGNIGYSDTPDFTDSAANSYAGGNTFIASANAGLTVSYDFVVEGPSGSQIVSPFVGGKLTAAHYTYEQNGGDTTKSDNVGGEMSLGLKSRFPNGATAGLEGRLGRQGDTTSASLTGSLSASF